MFNIVCLAQDTTQPSSGLYTPDGTGRNFLKTYHRAINIVSGTYPHLITGQMTGAGAMYYNITDSSLYMYDGLGTWVRQRGSGGAGMSFTDTSTMLANYLRTAGNLSPLFTTSSSSHNLTFTQSNAPAYSVLGRNLGTSGTYSFIQHLDSTMVDSLHTLRFLDTRYLRSSGGGGGALTFSSGLLQTGNNVVALHQNALWNANQLQGFNFSAAQPLNNQVPVFNGFTNSWEFGSATGGTGLIQLGVSPFGLIIDNDSTYEVDTFLISTNEQLQHRIDSLAGTISTIDTTDKWLQDAYARNDSLFKVKNGTETLIERFYPYNTNPKNYLDSVAAAQFLSAGDTTIFTTTLDSTGQLQHRVLFSGGNNHIRSEAKFLYDSTNHKLGINVNNISQGGTAIKLVVGGNALITGSVTMNSGIISGTPTTSAGSYDILTRNTSSGVVEKVASSTFLTSSSLTPYKLISDSGRGNTNYATGYDLNKVRDSLAGLIGGSTKFGKSGEDATAAENRAFNTSTFNFQIENSSHGGINYNPSTRLYKFGNYNGDNAAQLKIDDVNAVIELRDAGSTGLYTNGLSAPYVALKISGTDYLRVDENSAIHQFGKTDGTHPYIQVNENTNRILLKNIVSAPGIYNVRIDASGNLTKADTTSGGGSSTFVSLTDGPGSFSGKTLNYTRVNAGETALEYRTPSQVRSDIGAGTGNGTITSVSGTTNRITSTGGTTPVIDISASYVGQSSITTLGTVTTGTIGTGAIIGTPTMTLGTDATGDIYYRNSGGILTRLGIGTTKQTLHVVGGLPTWRDTSATTGGTVTDFSAGDLSPLFTTTEATTTTTPALSFALTNTTQFTVFGRKTSGSGAPSYLTADSSLIVDLHSENYFNTKYYLSNADITNAQFRQSAGLSVIGRSANTTGDVADITAGTDKQVLVRNGTSLVFNLLDSTSVTGLHSESYYNTKYIAGNQTITLSGDVSGSGTTAITTTIGNNKVTGAMIAMGSDAAGDVLYYNGTDYVRLAAGTTKQTLHGGTTPAWKDTTVSANALGTYLVQTSTNAPTNAQVMASLSTGLVKNTTITGVQSIATAGVDYMPAYTASTEEFTGSTSTSITLAHSAASAMYWVVTMNGVLFDEANYSISGTALTISNITRLSSDIIKVKYYY